MEGACNLTEWPRERIAVRQGSRHVEYEVNLKYGWIRRHMPLSNGLGTS